MQVIGTRANSCYYQLSRSHCLRLLTTLRKYWCSCHVAPRLQPTDNGISYHVACGGELQLTVFVSGTDAS